MQLSRNFRNNFLTDKIQYTVNYSFNKGGLDRGMLKILNTCRNRNKIIKYFFSPIEALSSEPEYYISTSGIIISLSYYIPKQNGRLNYNSINNLRLLLEKIFNMPVKLQFVHTYYPHMNRNILAEYLRLNTQKYTFRRIVSKFFPKRGIVKSVGPLRKSGLNLPSYIVGIKLEISGRLVTERARPRQTVSTKQIGVVRTNHKGSLIDYGTYVGKNSNGAYTVKVSIGQQIVV